ncbi:ParB/RepB/Spo0J family partition protein [Deinococcus wulumuqiensis]|uniref:ParB/RepB/Spo0J family partition protein n=1 Tax=Deinococcus wulumuqiensis TaxID=980427 RepID=UPI002430CCB7|nr:ParB/RepB/Spo0J family partition protein [Deinococcus wulumuqiensis]
MGKKKAEPEVDFNAMVEETRAKMQEKAAQGKKIGRRKAVPTLTYQPGDFVSYRHTEGAHTRYIAAVFSGEPSGLYELKLAPHSGIEMGAGGTLWADPEEVTPRVLRPITNFAPLAVGDRVERAICASDEQVPLEGVCTVVMCSDDVVTIADQGGTRWEGTVDKRLALRGRASLLAALADLGYSEEDISEAEPRKTEPAPEVPDDVAAPAELPGTPVPPEPDGSEAAKPLLKGADVRTIALRTLHASPLNPRKVFEQAALVELAESIFHQGLMQNLVIRPVREGDSGHYEVVAGGRRLRALQLLAEQGRISESYMVPVRVQPLSDLEALQLATAENVERRSMSPIEEADAFAGMVALGATPHDIALRFGFSEKTVQQRLVLAEGLGEDGRKLFSEGKIGLGQAQVIAQTTGPLRKHVMKAAASGSYDSTVSALQNLIKKGSFLVEHAKFDVAASGLEVVEDLYGDQPARFADPKAALARQLDWVQDRAKEMEGKKEQHFVDVVKHDSDYLSVPYDLYTTYNAPKSIFGTVIMVSTVTGQVKEFRCAREVDVKSARAKEQAAERKQVSSEATGSEGAAIRKQGWIDGHEARATALRSALVGDHKRAVALTILMMLEAEPVTLRASLNHVQMVAIPVGMARLKALDEKLGGKLGTTSHHKPLHPLTVKFAYGDEGEKHALEYLDTLLSLSLEELLDIQSVLIAQAAGGWSSYNPVHAPRPFMARLAADTGAVVKFKLTDEHLKAYPRDRLLELAADAGLTYIAGNAANLSTNKDIRAAILEYADALYDRGYVPPLARFPESGAPKAGEVQAFSDLVARAETLINDLDQAGLGAVLELDGYDPTDWDTQEEMRAFLREELSNLDDVTLKGWNSLWSQLPAGKAAD